MMYYYRYDPIRNKYNEYQIEVYRKKKYYMQCDDLNRKSKYWTRVPANEGEVRNNGVWFNEPNREEAIRRLVEASEKKTEFYENQFNNKKSSCEEQKKLS